MTPSCFQAGRRRACGRCGIQGGGSVDILSAVPQGHPAGCRSQCTSQTKNQDERHLTKTKMRDIWQKPTKYESNQKNKTKMRHLTKTCQVRFKGETVTCQASYCTSQTKEKQPNQKPVRYESNKNMVRQLPARHGEDFVVCSVHCLSLLSGAWQVHPDNSKCKENCHIIVWSWLDRFILTIYVVAWIDLNVKKTVMLTWLERSILSI